MPSYNRLRCFSCSDGLDYIVSQAQAYGIKLILTLTNYYVSCRQLSVYPCVHYSVVKLILTLANYYVSCAQLTSESWVHSSMASLPDSLHGCSDYFSCPQQDSPLRPLSSGVCLQQLGVDVRACMHAYVCICMRICFSYRKHAASLQSLDAWQKQAISRLAQMLYHNNRKVLSLTVLSGSTFRIHFTSDSCLHHG